MIQLIPNQKDEEVNHTDTSPFRIKASVPWPGPLMLETSPKLNLFYIQEVGVAGVQSGVLGLGAAEEWNVLTEKELVELERAQIFRASSHYRYLILSLSLFQVIRRFVRALLSLGVFWALLDPGLSDF